MLGKRRMICGVALFCGESLAARPRDRGCSPVRHNHMMLHKATGERLCSWGLVAMNLLSTPDWILRRSRHGKVLCDRVLLKTCAEQICLVYNYCTPS